MRPIPCKWQDGLDRLMGHGDDRVASSVAAGRRHLDELVYRDSWRAAIKAFYALVAQQMLEENSYRLAGRTQLDVVRDYGNLAHTHFVACLFNLPLKTRANRKGVFTEHEMYSALSTIFHAVFLDLDPVKSFPLRLRGRALASKLAGIMETNAKVSSLLGTTGFFTGKSKDSTLSAYGVSLIKGLAKQGLNPHDIAWGQILPTASTMVPNEAQLFAQAVDFYLSPHGAKRLDEVYRLAAQGSSDDSDTLLLGYALEGVRLSGPPDFCRQASDTDAFREDDGRQVRLQSGDRVSVSFARAARDSSLFPDPHAVNPRRPLDAYVHYGPEPLTRLGTDVRNLALVKLFRALFRKKGLRRVPGPQGELKRVPGPCSSSLFMTEDWGGLSPFPASMKVMWDD